KPTPHRLVPLFPVEHKIEAAFPARPGGPPRPAAHDFQKEADRILLSRFSPPGVLVDDDFNVLQFRGRTSPYLEQPPGDPTTGILKMVREGLFLEPPNALNETRKTGQMVRREGVRVRTDGGVREIAVEVVPVRPQGTVGCYLVLFQEPAGAAPSPAVEARPA